ncbi:MAG: SAM-dependent methyltransferase [Phycisphaerales bacterium]
MVAFAAMTDAPPPPSPERPFVSRAGEKLAHALRDFQLNVQGLACADFGCNVGGFTDCLLRAGAAHVHALDTGYGILDWRLRNDPRVTVMERTNALHAHPPEATDGVDLVVIDLAWTRQKLAVPAALRWLRPDEAARIVTLVKPHYEAEGVGVELPRGRGGVLEEADSQRVLGLVEDALPELGVKVLARTRSPIVGGSKTKGNVEYLLLLARS